MKHVKKEDAKGKSLTASCQVLEYPIGDREIDIAVAKLKGRYPEQGWALNRECKEMGFVLAGSGKLVTEHRTVELAEGDAVLIEPGEKYHLEGEMTLLMPTSPAWHLEQHAFLP